MATYFDRITGLAEQEWQAASGESPRFAYWKEACHLRDEVEALLGIYEKELTVWGSLRRICKKLFNGKEKR